MTEDASVWVLQVWQVTPLTSAGLFQHIFEVLSKLQTPAGIPKGAILPGEPML